MRMLVEQSRIADDYGQEVWIWYPAMDEDYSDPRTVEFALREWGEVFKALPRLDAVYVPAGDPGHTRPKYMLALMEKQTDNLRRYHPRAQMWTSTQSFDDAYVRSRLINETSAENRALSRLAEIRRLGVRPNQLEVESPEGKTTSEVDPLVLLNRAEAQLDEPLQSPVSQDWRTRILELGEALYQSIHMQLAVERYQAEAVERAANLDTLDTALSDAPWLKKRFAEIRQLSSNLEPMRALEALLDCTNPGPGGFYDDLGNLTCQSHLLAAWPRPEPGSRVSNILPGRIWLPAMVHGACSHGLEEVGGVAVRCAARVALPGCQSECSI